MNDVTPSLGVALGAQPQAHSLLANDRREITVKGVQEVLSFDDGNVRLVTVCGILNLEGTGLRIHVLNTRDGVVAVTGTLNGVLYENDPPADPSTNDLRRSGGDVGKGGRRLGRRFFS